MSLPPGETAISSSSSNVTSLDEYQLHSNAAKWATIAAVVGPFIAFFLALYLLWNRAVGWVDISLMVGIHLVAAAGITVGYHRMLTHRSFETSGFIRGLFTFMGSIAIEGSPTHWVADHRRHHAFSDEEGDPHSPNAGREAGFIGMLRGLYHAHVGWLFVEEQSPVRRYAPDLLKDKVVMRIDGWFPWFILGVFAVPFALGLAISGELMGGVSAMFWAGAVRMFLTHHITWSVNSICHMFGRRPFESGDLSTNNWVLALPTLGEAWHHNHHAFPTSAFHGLERWQKMLDPSGWMITFMEKTGLIWNVKRVTPTQMEAKRKGNKTVSEQAA